MATIGELSVSLGINMDASVENSLRRIARLSELVQKVGQKAAAATQAMNGAARGSASMWNNVTQAVSGTNSAMGAMGATSKAVARDISGIGQAMKQVTRDAEGMIMRQAQLLRTMRSNTQRTLTGGNGLAGLENISFGGSGISGLNVGSAPNKAALQRIQQQSNQALADLQRNVGGLRSSPGFNRARTAGNYALDELTDALNGTLLTPGGRSGTSWGAFRAGAPMPVGPERYFPSFGGGAPGTPRRGRGGGGPGGGGGGGAGGFNRLGPLGQVSSFRRMLFGAGIIQGVQELTQIADSYNNIQTRLRQVTGSQDELNRTYERLHGIANTSQADLKGVSESYVRIKQSTDRMGLSSEDTFKVVDRITKAFALSGATTAEANGAMTQLTQAFNSNKLAGDEFRTMAEQMPWVLKALSKTMKVPEDQLKAMAKEGRITRKVLVDTFLAANELDEQIKGRAKTYSGSWNVFKNDIMKTVGESLGDPKVLEAFTEILSILAFVLVNVMKALVPVIKGIGAFIVGLKEGKPWAIALAAAIGVVLLPQIMLLVAWLGRLAALPFTALLGNLTRLQALTKAGGISSALGLGGAGAGVAGGAGGAGRAVAGAGGVNTLATVGSASYVGQAIMAGLLLREGIGAVKDHTGIGNGKGGFWGGMVDTLTTGGGDFAVDLWKRTGALDTKGMVGATMRGAASANVTIGNTVVNIYAQDGKDAADQFTEDLINRRNREAAAVFNRKGS